MHPALIPVAALLVALARRAFVLYVEELLRAAALLRNNKACIPYNPAVIVAVALRVGVLGHSHERLSRNVLHTHQPLEGHMRVYKDGISVEEDNKVVHLKHLLNYRHLDLSAITALVVRRADKAIVISINYSCTELVLSQAGR